MGRKSRWSSSCARCSAPRLDHPMLKSVAISDAGMTKQTLYEIERRLFTPATYDRAMDPWTPSMGKSNPPDSGGVGVELISRETLFGNITSSELTAVNSDGDRRLPSSPRDTSSLERAPSETSPAASMRSPPRRKRPKSWKPDLHRARPCSSLIANRSILPS